jgi:hypothetical protein
MKRSDGERRSDYDSELDSLILVALEQQRISSSFRILGYIKNTFKRKTSWKTIQRHLGELLEKKKVKIVYSTEPGKGRNIILYKIT